MKRKHLLLLSVLLITVGGLTGCSKADRVSYNISKEADNFNTVRRLTVINNVTNDIVFQMTGKLSIKDDTDEQQLEITVEEEEGVYKKHFVKTNDMTMYLVEDLGGSDVSDTKYSLNFNPDMIIPAEVTTIE